MLDILNNVLSGLALVVTPIRLFSMMAGICAGTFVGLFPGLGSFTTIALLLPLLFGMDPITGIVMLCGIYYSATYSSAIVAILLRIPGDASAIMTTIDGHELANQGRGSQAIAVAGISSFIGATLSVVCLMFVAPPLINFTLRFSPAEYFALMFIAFVMLAMMGDESFLKGLLSVIIGLMLASIGTEQVSGEYRYWFGEYRLMDGLPFIPVAMGLFAISDVFINIEKGLKYKISKEAEGLNVKTKKLTSSFAGLGKDIKSCVGTLFRGFGIGFFTGVLPGAGATIASFFAYATEKKFVKTPEKYGKGMIQGVAAPEIANSSSTGGAMIPMLCLGIPGSKSTAMMLLGLLMMGVQPGPLLLSQHSDIFWAIVSSMYLGNVLVIALIMPLSAIFISRIVSYVSYSIIYPLVILFVIVGSYAVHGNIFEVYIAIIFGFAGYFMDKVKIPSGPLVIAMILGPMFEKNLLSALKLADGNPAVFFTRPICGTILGISIILILFQTRRIVSPFVKRVFFPK
jgi:putative tricarboxylic transport membrane protein